MIPPGTLVEFLQNKRVAVALCLRQDKPGRVFVRTDEGREEKLLEDKVLFSVAGFLDPASPPEQIDEALRRAAREREDLASTIPLADLWALLHEDHPTEPFSLAGLAEIYFGSAADPVQSSGLYRALESDRVFFTRKAENYLLRGKIQVEETLQRQQAEANRLREREVLVPWLSNLWQKPSPNGGAAFPEGFEDACRRILTWIREVSLQGVEARRFKDVQALLKEAGISRKDAPFQVMVKAGLWSEHENLLLHRFRTSVDFSDELMAEARRLADQAEPLADPSRRDLRHLECFTIDDVFTTEIDDALSLEELPGGGIRVGIHIADAAAYVVPDTALDLEARARATAIYLPDLKVRMLPPPLADEACSLVAGQDRPAFSFLVDYDPDFVQVRAEMVSSTIHVRERLSYESADEALQAGRWERLLALARALRDGRRAEGAVTVPFPRVNVRVDSQGRISIEREAANAPSQVLVSEMAVLANRIAGEFLAENGAAALFRSQEAPDKPIEDAEEYDPARAYAARRFMRKGTLGMTPARHHGLGLDYYTQVTSPIRRYGDLLMQRQIKALLAGRSPLYEPAQLEELLGALRQPLEQSDALEKDRRTYWILRYLEERLWQETDAVVVANHPDKHIVQLCDCLFETECAHVPGRPLPPGSRIPVRIELVWPRDSVVRVSPVGPEEDPD
jgi:exoribonuclease-2